MKKYKHYKNRILSVLNVNHIFPVSLAIIFLVIKVIEKLAKDIFISLKAYSPSGRAWYLVKVVGGRKNPAILL